MLFYPDPTHVTPPKAFAEASEVPAGPLLLLYIERVDSGVAHNP